MFAERTTPPEVAVPINPMVGRPPAELFTFSVAVRMPDDAGVNVIWNVQVAPAANAPVHAEGRENSPEAVPLREKLVIAIAEALLLVMVTDLLALGLPAVCVLKTSSTGDTLRGGKTPKP